MNLFEQTVISPVSNKDGQYPTNLTKLEYLELQTITAQHLLPHEQLEPLITAATLQQAVDWFSQYFLEKFQGINTRDVVFLYNVKGAIPFMKAVLETLSQIGIDNNTIPIHQIRVSRSNGAKSFGAINQDKLRWVDASELTEKLVFSFEDIGDTGNTQAAIRKLAERDGAEQVITVNMLERQRPPQEKFDVPDVALLMIDPESFVVGKGLDDGTPNPAREDALREMTFVSALITSLVE